MPKMIVSMVSEHGIASFQLATASGHAPQVCDVCVMDLAIAEECWEVSTLTRQDTRARWKSLFEKRLTTAGLFVPEGMEPFTDLLPSDPRYALAKGASADVDDAASTELPSLTYGVIPAGFVQRVPQQGVARPLEPGHMYLVVLLGRDFGSLTFAGP